MELGMVNSLGVYSGNGNTFYVLESRKNPKSLSELSRRLGYKYNVDGILFIDTDKLSMKIFDRDGTHEQMCGNGLRVTASLVNKLGILAVDDVIMTDDGPKRTVINGKVEVEIGRVENSAPVRDVAGVPHLVVPKLLSYNDAKHLRDVYNANVTTVDIMNNFYRTFEVGVEDFTKSCGTGAVAAASFLSREYISWNTAGGRINVRKDENGSFYISGDIERLR